MKRLAVLALLVAGACSSVPVASLPGEAASGSRVTPTQSSGTPVPSPAESSSTEFAVLVDLFAASDFYDIAIVAIDGSVVARARARKRSVIQDAAELPYVSTSHERVYYLDGDRDVRFLKPDGTSGVATTVPGGPTVHAAFAVTPDDARIAVTHLNYAVAPVGLTLYVADLAGANRKVIFTSSNHYVWPVAWHAGRLVVAYLGPNAVPFKSKEQLYGSMDLDHYPYGPSPYGGINFHVISPVTAAREAIITGGGASGLLTQAGVAVVQGDATNWKGQWVNWNSPNDYGSYSAAGSLSPDGGVIAACCNGSGGAGQLVLWYPGGATTTLPISARSTDWAGWFDGGHLITGFYQRSEGTPTVVDIDTLEVTTVDAHGIVAAMLPGGLDA